MSKIHNNTEVDGRSKARLYLVTKGMILETILSDRDTDMKSGMELNHFHLK